MLQASDSWIIPRYENGLKFQVAVVVVVVVLKLIGFVYVSDIGQIRLSRLARKPSQGKVRLLYYDSRKRRRPRNIFKDVDVM